MAAAEDAGEDGAAGKGAGGESAECLLVDGEGEDPSLGELGDAVDEQVLAVAQLDAERLLIAGRVPLADDVRKLLHGPALQRLRKRWRDCPVVCVDEEEAVDDEGNIGYLVIRSQVVEGWEGVVVEQMSGDCAAQRWRGEHLEFVDGAVQEIVREDGGVIAKSPLHRRAMGALGAHGLEGEAGGEHHGRDEQAEKDQRSGVGSIEGDHVR